MERSDSDIGTLTENGPILSNSVKCNEDRSNDKGDEIPKGASVAHHYLQKEKLVYVSFNIEAAGESCGIVQLSAQIFRVAHRNGVTECEVEEETFDKYVQPGKDAIWDDKA